MSIRIIIPIIGLLTSSCSREKITDTNSERSILECMREINSNEDYLLITSCSILKPQEHFKGTWFVSLGDSVFSRGKMVPTASRDNQTIQYEIVAPADIRSMIDKNIDITAYYVEFIGRESSALGVKNRKIIVLDKIINIYPVNRSD